MIRVFKLLCKINFINISAKDFFLNPCRGSRYQSIDALVAILNTPTGKGIPITIDILYLMKMGVLYPVKLPLQDTNVHLADILMQYFRNQ